MVGCSIDFKLDVYEFNLSDIKPEPCKKNTAHFVIETKAVVNVLKQIVPVGFKAFHKGDLP